MQKVLERDHYDAASSLRGGPNAIALPMLHTVVGMIARAPVKAVGEDLLGAGLYKSDPFRAAQMWLPIATKAVLAGRPPLQWAGGMLQEVPK